MRLCVVGFGLIGASVAAATRAARPATHVAALDRREVIGDGAAVALADTLVCVDDGPAVDRELERADLTVLAAPAREIADMLERVLARARLVTDCGSTKRAIVAAAARSPHCGRFVPGHPLAGGSQAGASAAHAELFRSRPWVLCGERSDPAALAEVTGFVAALGATPVSMSAAEHDRAVALTSHVPQILASALVVLSDRRGAALAEGPGFASATRVAGGNPEIWRDILSTNADEVAAALRDLARELERAAEGLEQGQASAGLDLIVAARRRRSSERY